MNKKEKYLKQEIGITLIALVVTIIVLIILAGISINLVLGENGIITRAKEASKLQEIAEIKEQVRLEIVSEEIGNLEGTNGITQSEVEKILSKYGTVNKNSDNSIKSLTPANRDYEIPYEEIYSGKLSLLPTDGSYSSTKKVNTPKIKESEGMKLVTFDEATKTWKEDVTKSDYDYIAGTGTEDNISSKWANATVTKDGIDSYFVWIPRYAYKITYYTDETKTTVSDTNVGYGSIDVKFIKGTGTLAADGTVCKYADDTNLTANDYIIHPAFTANVDLGGGFGELAGLWIGKFEASRSDADATNIGESTTLKVAPSVTSWRNINIGDMYTYAKAYNTNLNSHMLKNSEWGAVAYLTHSQYGRNGNEISMNQCSTIITGAGPGTGDNSIYVYDSSNFETTYSYISDQGKKASTTGNEFGIYDISGGAYEYVALYYNGSSYLNNASTFATNGGTNNEYSTTYTGTIISSNYIKGDATYETSKWNSDGIGFVNSDAPFLLRGGYYNENISPGSFYYYYAYGGAWEGSSFRTCLAVK